MGKLKLLLHIMLSQQQLFSAVGWSWSPLPAADGTTPRVSGHAAATMGADGVLLFGGLTGPAGSPTTNDLWHFGCRDGKWTMIDADGSPCPRVRMYAASAAIGTKFYIFGGWDPGEPGSGGEFLDDIWSFDWESKKWNEEDAKLPFPVSRHAAVAVGDMAIIHTYRGVLTFKDGVITEQATTGKGDASPDSISMCAMAAVGDKVVLFGGSDKTQQMSSEVYVLDTTDWMWTKLDCPDGAERPDALASASVAPLYKNSCIVFGGAGLASAGYQGGYGLQPKDDTWICTIKGGDAVEWKRVECNGRPEARLAASLNCLGDGRFLLQGGYDSVSKGTFAGPWVLSND